MTARALSTTAPPVFDAEARERFLVRMREMDRALVAAGFHPLSDWWWSQIYMFVRSGCRRWVVRAGRPAGKSSALCRLAVAVAWFGAWSVPTGDDATIPFISVSLSEASARLRTIDSILTALGLAHEVRGDEVEMLAPRRVFFRVRACSSKAVVGATAILVIGDEVARWEVEGANPAAEVIGSVAPSMATQPNAWLVLSSSPWSQDDYHAQAFDRGDDEHQRVSFGATWTCNPTISEADTHALEPDLRTWSREYAGVPGNTVSAAFDPEDVAACFEVAA